MLLASAPQDRASVQLLFVIWILFFLLGWYGLIVSLLKDQAKSGRHVSPLVLPPVGPVCGTIAILTGGHTYWLIPAVWLSDAVVLMFLYAAPWLWKEFYRHSALTRTALYKGADRERAMSLSLHRNSVFCLETLWLGEDSPLRECTDTGVFVRENDRIVLKRNTGTEFEVVVQKNGELEVVRDSAPALEVRAQMVDISLTGKVFMQLR